MISNAQMLTELRNMLHDVLVARAAGSSHPRLTRLQGFVDGYMRALLEAGAATQEELLSIVAEERAKLNGPATATVAA